MARMFGTDGVRGVANIEPMTAETVLQIGRATAYVCRETSTAKRPRIVIGKDTRVSGYMLENALTAGICSMGVDVLLVGPMPTPGIAFITQSMRADAGLVISASHNPYQDNGIKIFSREGYKLPDAEEDEIEELVVSGRIRDLRPTAHEVGKARRIDDAIGRYIVFGKAVMPPGEDLEGLKLVLDCANGATYKVAPIIFSELGAEVIPIHCEPDGVNINDRCGATAPGDLVETVRRTGAHAGLAFDGDGDRLIAVDETGAILTGDHVLAICAWLYREEGRLVDHKAVTTVMSNFALRKLFEEWGLEHIESKVGDRYVLEAMRTSGAVLGGESSGHLIFHDHHTTGDGIISALQLMRALRKSGGSLSALSAMLTLAPQVLINVDVARRAPLEEVEAIQTAIRGAEAELTGQGRVLVRYSGTQPMCRVMVEGPTEETTRRVAEALAEAVRAALG